MIVKNPEHLADGFYDKPYEGESFEETCLVLAVEGQECNGIISIEAYKDPYVILTTSDNDGATTIVYLSRKGALTLAEALEKAAAFLKKKA